MDLLVDLENVPRKEKQFHNFTVNSLKLQNTGEGKKIKDNIWKRLIQAKNRKDEEDDDKAEKATESKPGAEESKPVKPANESTPKEVSGSDDEPPKKRAKKEMKSKSKDTPTNTHTSFPSDEDVTKLIKKTLKKAPGQTMKFKVLRKEVKEILLVRANDDDDAKKRLKKLKRKKWKAVMERIVAENPKKMLLAGKVVRLVVKD